MQTSKIKCLEAIGNGFKRSTIVPKLFISDVFRSPGYASGCFWLLIYSAASIWQKIFKYRLFHADLIPWSLTEFRVGLSGAAHGWWGKKDPPSLKSVYNDESWRSYTLPKEDPKIYKSCDTPLEFCWYQHFFTGS